MSASMSGNSRILHSEQMEVKPNENRKQTYKEKKRKDHRLNDPCWDEHQNSLRCLVENKSAAVNCNKYIQNFNNCEKFWSWVMDDRRSKNIEPALPPLKDRDEVRKQYIGFMKNFT